MTGLILTSLMTGFAQDAATVPALHPLMLFSAEQKQQLMLDHVLAPQASVEKTFTKDFASSLSLLSRLPYVPAQRDQGNCGDCWQWAGTGVMEIAHDVQNGVHDRLSVQFINSCNTAKSCCVGGWLSDLAAFYSSMGYAIPWANHNAQFLSSSGSCGSAPCGSIATTPRYLISRISAVSITTHGVGQAQAIANLKSILNQNKAIWFGFFLGNGSDWDQFGNFWNNQSESALWTDFSCGQFYDQNNGAGGHAVLCVGYNDDNPANRYWIMVNSWGTTAARPNGVFRVSMDLDYDCADSSGGYNLYWQTLDVQFAPTAPANDLCSGAVTISGSGYTNTQSTTSATSTGDPAPSCVPGFGKGVWYKYTPASSGRIVLDTIGSDFDTGLATYTGTCGSLTPLACDDDSGSNHTSLITNSVTAGTTYYILAGGHNGLAGNLVFHLAFTSTQDPSTTIWAVSATASSQYSSTSWSAAQATGAPDTTACGDIITAWAPSSSGTAPEWLQLTFGTPRQAIGLQIHETYNAPFVYRVDLIDAGGISHTVWSGVDSTPCPGWFTLNIPVTSYLVSGAKIYTQAAGWEEIDAVGLLTAPIGVDHFTWSAIGSTQNLNTPFMVTITAWDAANNPATNFASPVALSGVTSMQTGPVSEVFGRIKNPSFENGDPSPSDWVLHTVGNYNQGNYESSSYGMPTKGAKYQCIWTWNDHALKAGDYCGISQNVDLTGLATIKFDASLSAPSGWKDKVKAEVLIDGISKWTGTLGGRYTDQVIDVSAYTGIHTLELRNKVLVAAASCTSQWVMFDNLCTYSGGPQLVSIPVAPASSGSFANGVWTGNITVPQTASNMVLLADDGAGHFGLSNPFQVSCVVAPPTITAQSQAQTIAAGSNAVFTVVAAGAPPLNYQWQFNGTNLANATASSLTLINVQPSQQGGYRVIVSNPGGSVSSQVAALTVVTAPLHFLPGSLERTNGQFRFTLHGQPGGRVEIQATTNLVNWTSLATLTSLTGTFSFLDPATNFTRRFYRALQLQ
jgi:hypothetical protein